MMLRHFPFSSVSRRLCNGVIIQDQRSTLWLWELCAGSEERRCASGEDNVCLQTKIAGGLWCKYSPSSSSPLTVWRWPLTCPSSPVGWGRWETADDVLCLMSTLTSRVEWSSTWTSHSWSVARVSGRSCGRSSARREHQYREPECDVRYECIYSPGMHTLSRGKENELQQITNNVRLGVSNLRGYLRNSWIFLDTKNSPDVFWLFYINSPFEIVWTLVDINISKRNP